jgi:hypothetical protein
MANSDLRIPSTRQRDRYEDDTTGPRPPPAARATRSQDRGDFVPHARTDQHSRIDGEGDEDTCTDFSNPKHDYDVCVVDQDPGGTGARVSSQSVLFVRESGDANEVDPKDVTQVGLGDCYLLAAVAGLASTPNGQAALRSAIEEHTDDQGKKIYSVRLYEVQEHLVGPKTFTERVIDLRADDPYVVGHAAAATGGGAHEIWPLVVEKAFAVLRGSYNAMGKGGRPDQALEALTGMPATSTEFGLFGSYASGDLKSDLAAGKVVVLGTREGSADGPYGLVNHHAYLVTGTETVDGKLFVLLHNPWNQKNKDTGKPEEPKPVPYAELTKWFSSVDVGSVRSAP